MKKIFLFFCLSLLASIQFAFAGPTEEGIATFYGDNFHGRKTSSQELYDKDQLTAAHRTLPYGTIVRVTVLATGASVEVRINDRGPFVKGRIISVSKKAAEILNILKETDPIVKIEVVQKNNTMAPAAAPLSQNQNNTTAAPIVNNTPSIANAPTTAPAPQAEKIAKVEEPKATNKNEVKTAPATASRSLGNNNKKATEPNLVKEAGKMNPGNLYKMQVLQLEEKGFGVQIAGYSDYEAVYNQLSTLQENHFKGGLVYVDELNGKNFYKVILGPFFTKEEANSYCQSLRQKHNMKDAFVVDLSNLSKKAKADISTATQAAPTPQTVEKTNAKVITTKK